ncbi:CsbD family protein [Niabella ginsengisoli]|uniref:CsbD family protein n=1 Tax=Niabella ginsengisoli TaxID=522298 RepID=A0ABS9SGP0_9BACT|nr:CsbD family protein [Niabella ginsengisoli]MCH5597524.1 CsbD family protein [Niabella ginsengisoli]
MSKFNDQVKGNWNIVKGNLKQKWADLTDDDLLYEEGKEDEVIGRIQKRTGETKENVNRFIDDLKFD